MNIAVAVFGSYYFYHWPLVERLTAGTPVSLIVSSLVYFVLNTTGVAGVIALTEKKSVMKTWRNCYFWSFPFYLVGASIGLDLQRPHGAGQLAGTFCCCFR